MDFLFCSLLESSHKLLSEKWIHFGYYTWKSRELGARGKSMSECLCESPHKCTEGAIHTEKMSPHGFGLNALNEAPPGE